MSNRKKQRIVIGTLVTIIVGMVVGYAAMSGMLNIQGTSGITTNFNIQFTRIEENAMVNSKTITKGGVGTTTANFTVDLVKPGSSAIYDLTVENIGSIDATLKSIEGIEESNNASPLDIKFSLVGIKEGQSLNAGESKTFQVRVEWDINSSTIPDATKTLTLKLNYEQKGSSGSDDNIASDYILNKYLEDDVPAGESGLVAIDNTGEITTSATPREYRYIGPSPDNYVWFNNELWRIIGIFDGQLKIIRKDSLGAMAWDKGESDGGTHGEDGWNDWSQSTLKEYLNGEYLNSIDSTFQDMISDYTWKLGGSKTYDDVTAQMLYERERGTEVYTDRPTEWTGKIALMYPSDYGFSTSGGSTTNRSSCLAKELWNWNGVSDCVISWVRLEKQWTLTTQTTSEITVLYVDSSGRLSSFYVFHVFHVRPSLYLNSSVKITSGTGKKSDPFILEG